MPRSLAGVPRSRGAVFVRVSRGRGGLGRTIRRDIFGTMASLFARRARTVALASVALMLAGGLTACAGEPGTAETSGWTISGSTATRTPDPTASPSPSSTTTSAELPTDCREILSEAVLAELGDTPLNDPAFAPNGVQPGGTLICVWRDPQADTTGLVTTISRMLRGPALDMLNALADDEGFTCYTPDDGTRCEKTWENETYPVTDGRTLFWRDDILIDTQYSNLAPAGYTDAIVGKIFGS